MTVDEIYLKIGQEVFNVIESENWEKAYLQIEISNGVVGYTGDYFEDDIQKDIAIENIDVGISRWIRELHSITTDGENNRWNKAVFSITSEGQFDMEFIWDQEFYDRIERLSKS